MSEPKPRNGIMDIPRYMFGMMQNQKSSDIIYLASNESAIGASPRAIQACQNALNTVHRYPDDLSTGLREAISIMHGPGINMENVVCGAGSDEILHMIIYAYSGPGDEVIRTENGFIMYEYATLGSGATPVIAKEKDFKVDVDSILSCITDNTKIIFVSNPNVTGTYITKYDLQRLHSGIPDDVILVIDSAYAEFVTKHDYCAGVELVNSSNNIVMTRTFSKAYGLAGLRIGWCYAPEKIADALNRFRGPVNISSVSHDVAIAAAKDNLFLEQSRRHNLEWRTYLENEIDKMGYSRIPSVTNFVFVDFSGTSAKKVFQHLLDNNIIVRELDGLGLPNYLRITVGLEHEMKKVVEVLRQYHD